MPTVLHVISGLKVGGAEMALLRLIRQSKGGRYSHRIVSLTADGDMSLRYAEAGIDVVALDFARSPVREFARLVRIIKRERPDIVQTWMYHADLFGGLAAKLAGCRRLIWGIRTSEVGRLSSIGTRIIRRLCASLSRWFPSHIVCAAEASRMSHQGLGYYASKMVVIPNGVELERWQTMPTEGVTFRREFGIPDDALVIGSVGRFNAVKDQETFVDAAGLVLRTNPSVWFLMIGRDVALENGELMAWVKRAGIGARLSLLGERRDLLRCYAAMDVFCMHSRTEGFPNAVAEAMACRLPCVVTDAGDARLLLGERGTVVPCGNKNTLADALIAMTRRTEAARQELGNGGYDRVKELYSMDACRKRFESIYDQLMTLEL